MNNLAPQEPRRLPSEIQALRHELAAMDNEFAAVLPTGVRPEEFRRVVLNAIQERPELVDADRQTFFRACLDCARDGLVPDGKEAFFDIRSTKVKIRGQGDVYVQRVVYMPMVRGFYKRAVGPGKPLKDWRGDVVCENDQWDLVKGDEESFWHKPKVFGDRGRIIGAYSIAVSHDGSISREFMGYNDLMKAKAKSTSGNGPNSPWTVWEDRMCIKTVVKRHSIRIPLNEDARALIDAEDVARDITPAPAPAAKAVTSGKRATENLRRIAAPEPQEAQEPEDNDQAQEEAPPPPQEPREAPQVAKRGPGRPSNAERQANRSAEAEMMQGAAQPAAAKAAPTASAKSPPPSASSQKAGGRQVTASPRNGGAKTASHSEPEPEPQDDGDGREQSPAQAAWDQGYAAFEADLERRPPRELQAANRYDELDAWYNGYDEAADKAEQEAMRGGDEAVDRVYS